MNYSTLFALSDIHGDAERMIELLGENGALTAEGQVKEDTLVVFCGDYVDRGPDSLAVIRQIMDLQEGAPASSKVVALYGNHDPMFLSVALHYAKFGLEEGDPPHKYLFKANGGCPEEAWDAAQDPKIISWLQNLDTIYKEGDYLFQHADTVRYYSRMESFSNGIEAMNEEGRKRLETSEGAWGVFYNMTDDRRFQGTNRDGLHKYLDHFGCSQVVHGHTSTYDKEPEVWMGGMAINIDGRMSSGYRSHPDRGLILVR